MPQRVELPSAAFALGLGRRPVQLHVGFVLQPRLSGADLVLDLRLEGARLVLDLGLLALEPVGDRLLLAAAGRRTTRAR